MSELYTSHRNESGNRAHDLVSVSGVFADHVDQQDSKITLIAQQLEELKALLRRGQGE